MGVLLDLIRVTLIVSIFLILAGGTMMVDSIWAKTVVQPMQNKGPFTFMVFELFASFVASFLIIGVIVEFIKSLVGEVFKMSSAAGGKEGGFAHFGLSIPGTTLIWLILTIILTAIVFSFIDFVIWHMPFLVLALVVIFIIVGWIKAIVRGLLH